MTIMDVGNKRNSLLRSFTGIFASIVIFNSSLLVNQLVYARDQQYLELINEEAQRVDKIDNIVEIGKQTPSGTINHPQPFQPLTSDTNSFILDVYTKLNSRQKKTNADKYYYLEQLDDEAQNLKPNKRTPRATANRTQAIQDTHSDSAGGDYLSLINKESNSLNNGIDNNINNRTSNKSKQHFEQQKLVNITEAQRKELEFTLKNKIPGIFHFYKKLGIAQKHMVVNEYLKSKRISTASKTILRLYGGKSPH